jgi:DNA-binding IclR family transcriptional regulator
MAGQLGLPKGTVHGILRTLQSVGFVEQDHDSGKYQLGAALLHIGSSYLDANELRTRALNWADSLATQSSESVRIGTLHDQQVLIVHHVFRPDDSRQALDVGSLVPLHATALGKALLAHHRYLLEGMENPLAGFTPSTITDTDELDRELDEVQARGWAGERGELYPRVASIAAPIEDRRGVIAGAISVSGPVERLWEDGLPRQELVGYVMETARTVSRELGAIPW